MDLTSPRTMEYRPAVGAAAAYFSEPAITGYMAPLGRADVLVRVAIVAVEMRGAGCALLAEVIESDDTNQFLALNYPEGRRLHVGTHTHCVWATPPREAAPFRAHLPSFVATPGGQRLMQQLAATRPDLRRIEFSKRFDAHALALDARGEVVESPHQHVVHTVRRDHVCLAAIEQDVNGDRLHLNYYEASLDELPADQARELQASPGFQQAVALELQFARLSALMCTIRDIKERAGHDSDRAAVTAAAREAFGRFGWEPEQVERVAQSVVADGYRPLVEAPSGEEAETDRHGHHSRPRG